MAVKFKDSYRVINNYIKELDFEGLMLLGKMHNLNTVLVRAEIVEAYLKGEDPEEMLEDLITGIITQLDKLAILSNLLEEA